MLIRHRKLAIPILICVVALLSACAPTAVPPTVRPTFTPTRAPTSTPTPTLTPTATPIPPLALTIRWPDRVSALEPVPVEVALVPPPGFSAPPTVRATVLKPDFAPYRHFELFPQGEHVYAAHEPLHLPLAPMAGDWRLTVDVQSELAVAGARVHTFQPAEIRFRSLTGVLPENASLRIPQAFTEVEVQGDQTAGGRVWRHGHGQVSIWWAPGPTKRLQSNTAVVMLEATYGGRPPTVERTEHIAWQEQEAFLFHETWPGEAGGPGEALVVQGADFWLYVVRLRAVGQDAVPALHRQVWQTFALAAGE